MGKFYVTTPIYYVNDVPHIGHAYTTVAADVLARYHKLMGDQVYFLTGTDEHGQKIQRAAEKLGITPQELVDRNAESFKTLWKKMNINYDDFIRTTDARHQKTVQAFMQKLMASNNVYLGEYEDWYCVPDETYWTATQLDEKGNCPACHRPVERLKEPSYFFKMSEFQPQLLKYMDLHPDCILPEVRWNETRSFVDGGLRDLSVSRTTFNWGIPVPGAQGHVIYVWVDALVNYISALGWPDDPDGRFKTFWPADVHLIGKDILRHHAVYWPCLLMAAGVELPKTIFAHGWWTVDGQKMSKSLGNFVDPHQVIDQFGLDAFRYFLLREVAFGQDGDFSIPALKQRINSDLANDLGNLLSRVCGMISRYLDGKFSGALQIEGIDRDLESGLVKAEKEVELHTRTLSFYKALIAIWDFINQANKYIDTTAPWALFKDPSKRNRLETVLTYSAASLRDAALLLYPYMPASSEKIWAQLCIEEPMSARPLSQNLAFSLFKPKAAIKKSEPLFPRVE
jgi:methionyl-tRNA synthetase